MTLTALPPMDVASRLPRLRDSLAAAGCEAVLVTIEDGTLTQGTLSEKSFWAILKMKLRTPGRKKPGPRKPESIPLAVPLNGEPV